MRTLLFSLTGPILCACLAAGPEPDFTSSGSPSATPSSRSGAGQRGTPIPPGVREADKLPQPADIPSQMKPVRKVANTAQLQGEAEELSGLAQNIPSEIDQVLKGGLPKDLSEQLKRIEKLSRELRKEVSR